MIKKISIKDMTREAWLKERAKDLGGSDMSAVLGMNPFSSPYKVWCEMTGRLPAFEGNLATEVGTALEEFVAQKFAEISGYGKRLVRSNFMWRNDKFPHLHASPDRLIHRSSASSPVVCGLECKTTSAFNTKRFKGIDFPMQYYAQCVAYMAVLEVPVWYLAVLVGNSEFHVYRLHTADAQVQEEMYLDGDITVDDEEFLSLNEAANDFWQHVEDDTPPAVDGSAATGDAIKSTHEYSEDGKEIALPFREDDLAYREELKSEISNLQTKMDMIDQSIKLEMGDAETAVCGKYKVTWRTSERVSLDTKRLKKESPDLYAMYGKTTTIRTFTVN